MVIYGSFYPWRFVQPNLPASPPWILLHAWDVEFTRRFIADVVINWALYVPVGMAGHLAFLRRGRVASMLAPVVIGTVLSASIEMTQLYVPGRACSAIDLVDNIFGTIIGVALGLAFEDYAGRIHPAATLRRIPDRRALALLVCWAASLVFPLIPVLWLGVYRAKLVAISNSLLPAPIPFLLATATWFAAGELLKAANLPRTLLSFSILFIPLQFAIITRQPTTADFLGAILGTILSQALPRLRTAIAPVLLALIFLRGLAPFQFSAPRAFSWIPFGGFLNMDWEVGLRILFEKSFLYGTAVWLFSRTGRTLPVATAIVTAVLILIEILEVWLPGHVPEVTDPVLALLIAFGLYRLGAVPPASMPERAP